MLHFFHVIPHPQDGSIPNREGPLSPLISLGSGQTMAYLQLPQCFGTFRGALISCLTWNAGELALVNYLATAGNREKGDGLIVTDAADLGRRLCPSQQTYPAKELASSIARTRSSPNPLYPTREPSL